MVIEKKCSHLCTSLVHNSSIVNHQYSTHSKTNKPTNQQTNKQTNKQKEQFVCDSSVRASPSFTPSIWASISVLPHPTNSVNCSPPLSPINMKKVNSIKWETKIYRSKPNVTLFKWCNSSNSVCTCHSTRYCWWSIQFTQVQGKFMPSKFTKKHTRTFSLSLSLSLSHTHTPIFCTLHHFMNLLQWKYSLHTHSLQCSLCLQVKTVPRKSVES